MGKMTYRRLNRYVHSDVLLTTDNVVVQELDYINPLHILSHFSFHFKIYQILYLENCIIVFCNLQKYTRIHLISRIKHKDKDKAIPATSRRGP
jgi:hypothetical protein